MRFAIGRFTNGRFANMQKAKGFTLIELMIVVAIIGILSMIGIPAYNDYVTRGKLVDATSKLADMRIQLEQYYQDNRNYGSTAPVAASQCPLRNTLRSAASRGPVETTSPTRSPRPARSTRRASPTPSTKPIPRHSPPAGAMAPAAGSPVKETAVERCAQNPA